MQPNSRAITELHNLLDNQILQGFTAIQSDVNWLFNFLCILTICLTAILAWAWEDAGAVLRGLIQKMLLIGFIGLLINNWHSYSMIVVTGMTKLGLKAGGSTMSADTFWASPQTIFTDGLNLFKKLQDAGSDVNPLLSPIAALGYLIAGLVTLLAFGWLALSVFVATLEFKIVTLAGMIFLPFAIWPKLSFLSERAIGYVFSFGAKMLTLGLIVSVAENTVANVVPKSGGDLTDAFAVCGISLALLFIAISASKLAAALVSGGPQLGAGSAVGMGAAVAAAGVGAAVLGASAASTAGSSVLSRFQAASAAGNMARASGENPLVAAARGFASPSSVASGGGGSGGRSGGGGTAPMGPPGGTPSSGGSAASPVSGPTGGAGASGADGANGGSGDTAAAETGSGQSTGSEGGAASAASAAPETASADTGRTSTPSGGSSVPGSNAAPSNGSSPSSSEGGKTGARSYQTGGAMQAGQSQIKKMADELRSFEGGEGTGSIGSPDIHK